MILKPFKNNLLPKIAGIVTIAAISIHFSNTAIARTQVGEKIMFPMDAIDLNSTCSEGFAEPADSEAKGFCMGFIYAVTMSLKDDGWACTPADFSRVIAEAARLLSNAKANERSWEVLEKGFTEKFECPTSASPPPIPTTRPTKIPSSDNIRSGVNSNVTILRARPASRLTAWSIKEDGNEFCIAQASFSDGTYLNVAKTHDGYFISFQGEQIFNDFLISGQEKIDLSFNRRTPIEIGFVGNGDFTLLSDVVEYSLIFNISTSRYLQIRLGGESVFQYELGNSEFAMYELDQCFQKLDTKPLYLVLSLGAGGHDSDDEPVRWTYEWKKMATRKQCEEAIEEANSMMFNQDTYSYWNVECSYNLPNQ